MVQEPDRYLSVILIDSHCHFDHERFDGDREQAYQRAREAGVAAQIIPGIKQQWWPRIRSTCRLFAGLFPAYGLHPMYLAQHSREDIDKLEQWVQREQPVAIGECGLDYLIENPQREQQQAYFEAQLEMASQYRLPVIIHARRAVEEVTNTVRRYPGVIGVLHSYSGSLQQAQRLVGQGFLVSFGGPLTNPRATRVRSVAQSLPLEAILLESDSPDQPDIENRGNRNEPARLGKVLAALAELRKEPLERIATATRQNTERLFSLDSTS